MASRRNSLKQHGMGTGSAIPIPFLSGESSSKGKATLAANDFGDAVLHLVNESSVGLYRIQEHVLRKTPQLYAEKRELSKLSGTLENAISDLTEAQHLVTNMRHIDGFVKCNEHLVQLHTLLGAK
ncbi:hypothetical protein HDU76_013374 [Blyttiomyces sp. JEL0837]|nr:hypothetical protein HDU76_013374 [Blyttiomyces sp. JEL0837]